MACFLTDVRACVLQAMAAVVVVVGCEPASQSVAFPAARMCAPAAASATLTEGARADVSFLVQSDTHFGGGLEMPWFGPRIGQDPAGPAIQDIHRSLATQANAIEGKSWPAPIGGPIDRPVGMLIAGDLTEDGDPPQWDEFVRVYGDGKLLNMPVAESIGNHDHRVSDYVAEQVTRRHGAVAYSFDWGLLHVVSLGEEPTSDNVAWLRRDLDCVPRPAPIVLFFHKPVAGPYSTHGWLADDGNASELLDAIRGHDVAAIFHGHVHETGPYVWHGIPVYVAGSAKSDARSFLVVRVTDDRIQVAAWNYEFQAFWWWDQRPRHGAANVRAWQGKRAFGTREPLVPYPP